MTGFPEAEPEVFAVLADLHLADGRSDPFTADQRFAECIGRLVASAEGRRLRLVLLGDTFDFPAVTLPGRRPTPATHPEEATRKLECILAAHPDVLEALRGVLAAGHAIDFVAGNHDMELLVPAVEAHLRDALGGSRSSVRVHPWILYVPGLLYAEHGQQHHDVNRFPGLCSSPSPDGRRLAVPAGSYLDALVHLRARSEAARPSALAVQALYLAGGLIGGLIRLGRAERGRKERERGLAALDVAGLPPATVIELDRVGAATPLTIARRAGRMLAGRVLRSPSVPYMQAAARAVHEVLLARRAAVPFYLYGHTHTAADLSLPGAPGARYLNPGTWSSMVHGGTAADAARFQAVIVERAPGAEPTAELVGFS